MRTCPANPVASTNCFPMDVGAAPAEPRRRSPLTSYQRRLHARAKRVHFAAVGREAVDKWMRMGNEREAGRMFEIAGQNLARRRGNRPVQLSVNLL